MITLVRAIQTSAVCLSQWDAWDADGNYYYIRYRFGQIKVCRYSGPGWYRTGEDPQVIAELEHGGQLDGNITLPELARLAGLRLALRCYQDLREYLAGQLYQSLPVGARRPSMN
jgi:hypothetical protein